MTVAENGLHGCGFWCDFCELWVPIDCACLTGCKRCFVTLHSSNFPERAWPAIRSVVKRDILTEDSDQTFGGDGGPEHEASQ